MAMKPGKPGGPAGKPKPTPKATAPAPKSTRRTIPLNQPPKPPAKATPVKKTTTKATPAKMTAKVTPGKSGTPSKGGPSLASKIAKRVGTTAREAREVVTAASSVGLAALDAAKTGKATALKQTVADLPKQVGQVAKTAVTGKAGNAPLKVNTGAKSRFTNRATATRTDWKKKK
jgi:hypothetical protein